MELFCVYMLTVQVELKSEIGKRKDAKDFEADVT